MKHIIITILLLIVAATAYSQQVITNKPQKDSDLNVYLTADGEFFHEVPQEYPADAKESHIVYTNWGARVYQDDKVYKVLFSKECDEIVQLLEYQANELTYYWTKK